MKKRIGYDINAPTVGESYKCYIPKPLPPNPPLNLQPIYHLLDQANIALGRLDGISERLPDITRFLYSYIRKEAVLSSQIEGTQSSLSDLLLFENKQMPGVPLDDVKEVSHYVVAMEHGLQRLKEGFPLCLRLIKEIHGILLKGGRGSYKQPGKFRNSQNWIGGTRPGNAVFVPPPPDQVIPLLGDLEKFLLDEKKTVPVLIKAALAHVQFETIHPFLDGNGRLGRLLITFILCVDGLLTKPLLYLSLYFKRHHQQYYHQLQSVRQTGDWEAWIVFFLEGVIETANQAVATAQKIMQLFNSDQQKIKSLPRIPKSAVIVHQHLQKHIFTDIKKISQYCKITIPTATKSIKKLQQLSIVREVTGKKSGKLYVYGDYLALLNDD